MSKTPPPIAFRLSPPSGRVGELPPTARRRSPAPFDALAADYDQRFTDTELGRILRARVWRVLDRRFAAGETVLDLGCGTGADALHLAARGVRVVAADASAAMLELARRKTATAGLTGAIAFLDVDLDNLAGALAGLRSAISTFGRPPSPAPAGGTRVTGQQSPATVFRGAYSDFGALNAVANRRALAAALAELLPPGAPLIVVVMPPLCPWELVWHLVHGEPGVAWRRLRGSTRATLAGGASLAVDYPTAGRLAREFAPQFRVRRVESVGLLLPPTHLAGLAARFPRATALAARCERALATLPPFSRTGDHLLVELERGAR